MAAGCRSAFRFWPDGCLRWRFSSPPAFTDHPRRGAKQGSRREVAAAGRPRTVSFRNEVVPVLTKLGCNQGACHGAQHGKGGFKLSLLGFEPERDYTAIVKSAEERRVTPFAPEESLLLLKPTLAVAHGGGKRMEPDSPAYRLLIALAGTRGAGPARRRPARRRREGLSRPPADGARPGAAACRGRRRSATAPSATSPTEARFDTLNEGVAKVRPSGLAKTVGQGETNIMVRYQGHAAMARLTVPFAREKPFDFPAENIIDVKAAAKWRELGLVPSPLCTDAEFLRRAMLDAIGTTPTPDEVEDFLADDDPDKRTKLVDRLLDRPEYVDYWTLKWGDLLRVNSDKLGAQGMLAFNLWLREAFRANKPVNRMVEELVTAQGSIYSNGPANYFRVASSPDDLAETTAQVFMGVRLQCAKCHHHPFEAYGQDDYYGLAAYFARIRTKASDEFGLFGREQVVYVAKSGEVCQPRTGKKMAPRPLGGAAVDDPVDRRRALANWLTAENRHWLARNVVNRYWGYLMGKGLVNPIDDLRETNPAVQPRAARRPGRRVRRGGLRPQGAAPPDPHQPRLPVQRTGHARQPARHDVLHPLHDQAADRRAIARRDRRGDRDDGEVSQAARRHPCDRAAGHAPTRRSSSTRSAGRCEPSPANANARATRT